MFDVRYYFRSRLYATSNVTSYEVDSDLERWIVDIIHRKWSDVIGQIHLSMWQKKSLQWFI